jgi:predicted phage terminase large subunit-like protein
MTALLSAEDVRAERAAKKSLIDFRSAFFATPGDVGPAPFHHEWSDILLRGAGHVAVEAFRESAKTQIVLRANLLHALAYPSRARSYIAVICANKNVSAKKLREISREIRSPVNAKLACMIEAFAEDSGDAIEARTKAGFSVRIESYGKGSAVRGMSWGTKRPDLVIIDDPQDIEDAGSETVTENDWNWFLSDVIFLGERSRIFLIGNNLGKRCIIERVFDNADELKFKVRRLPVMDAEHRPAWPARHTAEGLLAELDAFSAMGKRDIWWREKMCEAISPESQRFKPEMFRYLYARPGLSGCNVYTAVDLASSRADTADRTAIVTVAVNPDGHWLVLDLDAGRYDPTETIDHIFGAVIKWSPMEVGIESVAYQSVLSHFLEKEMPRRNRFFTIRPLKAEKKKELRIDTLQPRFSLGTVWFPERAPWTRLLESELTAFPFGAHDDAIDALAYIEQMAAVPVRRPPAPAAADNGGNRVFNPYLRKILNKR